MSRIQNIPKRGLRLIIGVGLVLIPFVLGGCEGTPPKIKTIQTVPPEGEVPVGGEIPIEARIEPTGLPVTFKWITDPGGEMRVINNEVQSGVYIAPRKAGTYLVTVQMFYRGKKVDEKSIPIKVSESTGISNGTPLTRPQGEILQEIQQPPLTPTRGTITITSPRQGQRVPHVMDVVGTSTGLRQGTHLGVDILPEGDMWYRQSKPGIVGSDGSWRSKDCPFGRSGTDSGVQFTIKVVLEDEKGNPLLESKQVTVVRE